MERMSHLTPATSISELFCADPECKTFEEDTILQHVLLHLSNSCDNAVIVTNKSVNVGILTLKDIIRHVSDYDNFGLPVRQFMSTPLITFDADSKIIDIIDRMQEMTFNKIVAVKEDNIVGIVDRRHLLAQCYEPVLRHEHHMVRSLIGFAEESKEELLRMATTDMLTGIGNRRLFEEVFDTYRTSERREDQSLFLLLLDIDFFKSINDTFGHSVGDSVLKEIAKLLSVSIRKSDILVRWGGEEFAILLRYADPLSVSKVAEQVRKKIDEHSFETMIHVTCSFGLTSVGQDEDFETVFDRADRALYRAKADGKNCIRMEMP